MLTVPARTLQRLIELDRMQKGNLDTSKEELQFNDSDFEDDEVAIVEGGAECLNAPDDAMDPDPNDPRRAYYF